jgi:tRNA(adenine34) deaminase
MNILENLNQKAPQEEIDKKFMREALREAKKAYSSNEVPIGAVLVLNNQIIARGYNQVETLRDATAHAEMICLTAGSIFFNNWRLLETTIYVTIEPCCMCAGAMFLSRVDRLVWGACDTRVGANGSWVNLFSEKHPIHQVEVTGNVLEEESKYLMKSFFEKQRKIKI